MRVLEMKAAGAAMSASGGPVTERIADSRAGEISELSETACMILISASTVGRIAYVSAAGPELVSVNFALADGVIYFLADANGFLARLKRGKHAVAFGVDYHADSSRDGWDITITGTASRAGDRAARRMLCLGRLRPDAGDSRPVVMQIPIASVTGRRVHGGFATPTGSEPVAVAH